MNYDGLIFGAKA